MRAKSATMRDVAKAANVSQSTVSMILSGKSSSFPTATIEKVLSTAAAMNYTYRKSAPAPTSSTVLVITVQLTNPYYAAMQQGVDRAAKPESINVLTACSYHDPQLEAQLLQSAVNHAYLGVIFLYPPDNYEAYLQAKPRIPIVTICDRDSNVDGDIVELNNFRAGALAARHLLDLGHSNLAVLTHASDRGNTSRATRVAGILSEIRKALPEDHLLLLTGNNSMSGYLSENSFHYHVGYSLAQNKKLYQGNITGLICGNDMLAYGVMDALIEKGFRIPEDFSVIGSDNILFSGMSRVSLTSIEHYTDVVAHSALTTLLNRVRIPSASMTSARFQVKCEPTLMIRGSTGPVRSAENSKTEIRGTD